MINQLHTNCRDCAFAKYDKSTQVGCDFDRIESYKESGAEVLELMIESVSIIEVKNGQRSILLPNLRTL